MPTPPGNVPIPPSPSTRFNLALSLPGARKARPFLVADPLPVRQITFPYRERGEYCRPGDVKAHGMKRLGLTVSCLMLLAAPMRAQFIGPDALGGAAFGALFGSVIGADCHGLSGKGAAIGAGVGFLAGGLIGAANERACREGAYIEPTVTVYPGYGYGYGMGYTYVYTPVAVQPAPVAAPAPPPPAPTPTPAPAPVVSPSSPAPAAKPKAKPAAALRTPARPMAPQVPDAPRVPDAPTF